MGSHDDWGPQCGTKIIVLACAALFGLGQRELLATPWGWIIPFCALLYIGLVHSAGMVDASGGAALYFGLLAAVVLTVLVHVAEATLLRIATSHPHAGPRRRGPDVLRAGRRR